MKNVLLVVDLQKQFMDNGKQLPVEVDAITGATKTSVGVKEMIDKTLQMYLPYFNKQE